MGLRNLRQKQARATAMLEQRILHGKTNREIAKSFNVAPATVTRAMSLAAKGDLLISFEDKLHQELLPLAHDALIEALTGDNVAVKAKVATELFKGTNLIKRMQLPTATEQQDADDLSAYIFAKRTQALLEETSIDVTAALARPDNPDPAAAPGPDAPRNSDADGPAESAPAAAPGGRPTWPPV